MPIMLKDSGGTYAPPPEGTHLAVCFRICDVGVQPDSGFGEKHKLVISWELPNEIIQTPDGPKPMGVSKTYSFSLNDKSSLRRDLVRWRGRDFTKEELKGFALHNVLGKGCQISIVHTEQGKGKIEGVFAAPKGMPIPKAFNPLVEYDLYEGKNKTYEALPNWIKAMVDEGIKRLATGNTDEHLLEPPEDSPAYVMEVPF